MLKKLFTPKKDDICPNCGTGCLATDITCPNCGKNLDDLFEQLPITAEKSKSFKSLVRIFTLFGVLLGIVAGLINLPGALSSGSNVRLADTIFSIVYGVLLFVCSRILAKGKVLVIWVFSGCIFFSIIYTFIMGRGFNFVIAAIGALFIWQLFRLKKQGELL